MRFLFFQLFSVCPSQVRWMIQVPRLYHVYRKLNLIKNFGELLTNIFEWVNGIVDVGVMLAVIFIQTRAICPNAWYRVRLIFDAVVIHFFLLFFPASDLYLKLWKTPNLILKFFTFFYKWMDGIQSMTSLLSRSTPLREELYRCLRTGQPLRILLIRIGATICMRIFSAWIVYCPLEEWGRCHSGKHAVERGKHAWNTYIVFDVNMDLSNNSDDIPLLKNNGCFGVFY